MTRHARRFATMAVALTVTLIGLSLPARAQLIFTLASGTETETISGVPAGTGSYTGNGPSTLIESSTPGSLTYLPTAAFNGVEVNALNVSSNSPGTSSGGNVQEVELDFLNKSSSAVTLTLTATAAGFTFPTPGSPGTLSSTLGNNSPLGNGSSTFTSAIGTGTVGTATGGETFGSIVASTPLLSNGLVSGSVSASATGTVPSPSYALQTTLTVTLAAGGSDDVTATTSVTAVPEPSSFVMAGVVALGLMGYGLRRKALGA